ncbi:MAG: sortase family protein LPXTG-site transpeptidase [Acidimicrobiales bacterium]|nr:sortase family protein LPXTG-site transpeptidase [Acidimicrobiales bacterium]
MGFRRVVAGIGRTLITIGVLILLFVAYQLWGTGISEARDQHRLKDQFKTQATTPTTTAGAPARPLPPTPGGEAVAIIDIPKINIDKAVVEGVGVPDLKKGPGHYPQTPMPGHKGNAAIAGHRTTYGHPFYDLDALKPGDQIIVSTREGKFEYRVDHSMNVDPHDVAVLNPTPDDILTLTTCTPRFSAAQRLIVVSKLVGPALESPPPAANTGTQTLASEKPGLSGKQTAKGPAIEWGVLAALVFFGTWYLARRWQRWPAYLIGTPVFLFILYFFFENIARLLPANI